MSVSIQENQEALETSKTATVLDYPIRLGKLEDLVHEQNSMFFLYFKSSILSRDTIGFHIVYDTSD